MVFVPHSRRPDRKRPTAGQPSVDLEAIAGYLDVDGTMTPITVADQVVEVLAAGGFEKDAAARAGVDKTTLRGWVATGSRARRQVLAGERRAHDLTEHEGQCVRLLARVEKAEADARTMLTATAARVAQGGIVSTERTRKTDADGQVSETVTTRETLPDGRLALQMLAQRWPAEWGRNRIEITGADGGPVTVDAAPIRDMIAQRLAAIRERTEAATPESLGLAVAPNGSNGNGSHT